MSSRVSLLPLALCSACVVSSSAYVPGGPPGAVAAAAAPAPAPIAARVVAVRFTSDPPGAEEIAVVEAHATRSGATLKADPQDHAGIGGFDAKKGNRSSGSLQAIVDALRARTAEVGGDAVRVDRFATTYDVVREAYRYDCSETRTTTEPRTVSRMGTGGRMETRTEMQTVTKREHKTCNGYRDVEVPVLTLVGRAFRTKGASP
jgi:hypothetical protein